MILDSKLTFLSHIKEAIVAARRDIGIIRFLSKYVTRDVLDQIYKLYVRPHLDYGDIIYHKYDPKFKFDFTKRVESTQYSAALAVSGAWRGTNTDKIYEEKLAGKSFIIGDGTAVYVTFINCKVTKTIILILVIAKARSAPLMMVVPYEHGDKLIFIPASSSYHKKQIMCDTE